MTVITHIADLQALAKKRVPKMFYDYADSGSWTEGTYRANENDFHAIQLRQRVAVNMENRSTATTMVGVPTHMPVSIAPVGLTGMQHADGEIHAAQAAKKFGIPFTLSTMSICSIEDIAQHTQAPFWFQLYMMRDRDAMAKMIGTQPFHAMTFDGHRYDCGSKVGFVEATLAIALQRPDMGAQVRAIALDLLK